MKGHDMHDHEHHDHEHHDHEHHEHERHEHERHEHDENCSCGMHDHSGHTHDHAHAHADGDAPEIGVVHVESHLHDDARVISGRVTLIGDERRIKAALKEQLETLAKAVFELGGIVGHIKASCETRTVEMFSVTDVAAMSKTSPETQLAINLAAIVFAVGLEQIEDMVSQALRTVKASAQTDA
jgi:hypothetical protein